MWINCDWGLNKIRNSGWNQKTCPLFLIITHWLVQKPMTTAGPNDRAGFMLAPVNLIWCAKNKCKHQITSNGSYAATLTAIKCPTVIDSPTANGTDPLTSDRRSSHTACTTKTSTKVISASISTAWPRLSELSIDVVPKLPTNPSGVANYRFFLNTNTALH